MSSASSPPKSERGEPILMEEPKSVLPQMVRVLLEGGDRLPIPAQGNSMKPIIVEGDLVRVAPIGSLADLKIGDIVLFERGEGLILHRVIAIGKKTVILKGDGEMYSDGIITGGMLLGRAESIHRGSRAYVISGLRPLSRGRAYAGLSQIMDFIFRLLGRLNRRLAGKVSTPIHLVLYLFMHLFRLPLTSTAEL